MHDYAILAQGPYRADQVTISYMPGARRITRPDDQVDAGRIWQDALDQARRVGTSLYDGQLFRLMSFEPHPEQLCLRLGDTSYREYVVTRSPEYCRGRAKDELAEPLAVCTAIITREDRVLVERRQRSEVGIGRYHVIGGFLERDKDIGPLGPDPFQAMAREIREEIDLEIAPRDFVVLGLVYDRRTPHPELCLTVSTQLSFAEVVRRVPRESEVLQIESIDAKPTALSSFLAANHGNLTPTGAACLALYAAWREAGN
ncbi:MAG: NUDIX hydrolase [Chloroflexota bacterium]|nr:MAG: NUDIX hydrolase [Chloroflexota bacterium]